MNPLIPSSLPTRHPAIGHALHDGVAHLIARLAHDPRQRGGQSCPIAVDWTPQGAPGRTVVRDFDWSNEPPERLLAAEEYPDSLGERELTGRAAVVAAALLLSDLEGLSFDRVGAYGDRGDYWLSGRAMVEISGIREGLPGNVTARVEEKTEQLFLNPDVSFGFVSITMFCDRDGAVVGVLCHRNRRDHGAAP